MCVAEDLARTVQEYQRKTGEQTMLIVVEDEGSISGIHSVGFEPHFGLLVDGRQPSVLWYQQLQAFHPLETPPTVLH